MRFQRFIVKVNSFMGIRARFALIKGMYRSRHFQLSEITTTFFRYQNRISYFIHYRVKARQPPGDILSYITNKVKRFLSSFLLKSWVTLQNKAAENN